MKTEDLPLELGASHVQELTKLKKPILAIEELIWNALDADATLVRVVFEINVLQGIDKITVTDNGDGIDANNKKATFGKLGDSLKKQTLYTKRLRRTMHGKEGKGRFRALGLGNRVEWFTRYADESNKIHEWTISADSANLRRFRFSGPTLSSAKETGCVVAITNLNDNLGQLLKSESVDELTARLALYLKKYNGITIDYNGTILDPSRLQADEKQFVVSSALPDGNPIAAEMTIIEWTRNLDRKLYACDSNGFSVSEFPPSIHAPGYYFTAYLKCQLLDKVSDASADVIELLPGMSGLLDASRQVLRVHFKTREVEKRHSVIERWKQEGVYPYAAPACSPLEKVEREVFDFCALNVHDHLSSFETNEPNSRKLTLRLIKQALETSPSSLQEILREVLALPVERQRDLADLLKKTTLENIIKASKLVTDRLDFLGSLRVILFDFEYKQRLLERTHLQNILINELWVFGEEYILGHNDETLRSLLDSHINILGRPEMNEEVRDINGNNGKRPDLMLHRRYTQRKQGEFEHLVVELKRPKVVLGAKEINQIRDYAYTVSADERFDKGKTKWTFLLVGDALDAYGEEATHQSGRPDGLIEIKPYMEVWVKPWSAILQACEWQYDFYRKALEHEATKQDSAQYLQEKYAKHLPDLNQPAAPKKRGSKGKKAGAASHAKGTAKSGPARTPAASAEPAHDLS